MDQAAKNGNIRDDLSGCLYGCDVVIAEIAKQTSRWKFPKSKTGGNVTVPFTFREDR